MTEFNPEKSLENLKESETTKEKATDVELADFLIKHIDNPCGVEVNGKREHIRPFYLRLARESIGKMKDQEAIKKLQEKIDEYKEES